MLAHPEDPPAHRISEPLTETAGKMRTDFMPFNPGGMLAHRRGRFCAVPAAGRYPDMVGWLSGLKLWS